MSEAKVDKKPSSRLGIPPSPAALPSSRLGQAPAPVAAPANLTRKVGKKWHDINFKVRLEFRMEFKQRAARHNLSMVQLLYAAYKLWVDTYDPEMPVMPGLLVTDDDQ